MAYLELRRRPEYPVGLRYVVISNSAPVTKTWSALSSCRDQDSSTDQQLSTANMSAAHDVEETSQDEFEKVWALSDPAASTKVCELTIALVGNLARRL